MRAELWRDSRYVGFVVVAAGGRMTEDFTPSERERIVPIVGEIRERLLEADAWADVTEDSEQRPAPGDSRWFDRFLTELQKEGYEHRLLEEDGHGRGGSASD